MPRSTGSNRCTTGQNGHREHLGVHLKLCGLPWQITFNFTSSRWLKLHFARVRSRLLLTKTTVGTMRSLTTYTQGTPVSFLSKMRMRSSSFFHSSFFIKSNIMVNVVPSPFLLSSEILPSIISVYFFAMVSPSPVPS